MSGEQELSKSARKRANQKARAAEAAEAEPPAPAAPAPKAKAAAKEQAAPKAKGKAKAEPKAPEPAPAAKAEAKAKAKGKAKAAEPAPKAAAEPKAKAKAAAEPKAAAAKPAAKGEAKAKAKGKAKKGNDSDDEPEQPKKKKVEDVGYFEIDDGSNAGAWEVSTGLSKKQAKRAETMENRKAEEKNAKALGAMEARGSQHIPGLAPVSVQLAQAKGGAGPKAKQAVSAVASAAAVDAKGKEPEAAKAPDNSTSVTIKVPENKIGWVVGPKGATVNLIKEKTGVKTVDMSGDMCTLVGDPDSVALAAEAVNQLIAKGYMSLQFDDFEEASVQVLATLLPDIIGQKGAIIQLIKKEAKCEVTIPQVNKNGPAGKKYPVTLAGSKAAVTLGKQIIESIAMYGHHEITHPGMVHEELEVEEWRYRFLIGSKGSEMRHIQNSFKVRVNIPREHAINPNVVIIGEQRDVERAVKYCEKVLYETPEPKGRGATEKADDHYGAEGEVEDWMKPYMYNRK